MWPKRRGELTTKLERYTIGSQTLNETKAVVDELKAGPLTLSGYLRVLQNGSKQQLIASQASLAQMQPTIEQAKKDTAELMVKVQADQEVAREKSEACAVDEKAASEAASEAGR